MLTENFKTLAIYLKDVAVVVLEQDGSVGHSIDDKEWSFPLAL